MNTRFKNLAIGSIFGALFGVAFAAAASVLHMGPELWHGISETWWFFAILGAFAGWFHPRDRQPLIS